MSKFFAALLIIFKFPNKIILMVQQNYFLIRIQQNFKFLKTILSVNEVDRSLLLRLLTKC